MNNSATFAAEKPAEGRIAPLGLGQRPPTCSAVNFEPFMGLTLLGLRSETSLINRLSTGRFSGLLAQAQRPVLLRPGLERAA